MKRTTTVGNWLILGFGVCCLVYYLILGIGVRFGQSLMWLWPVVSAACIGRFLLFRNGAPGIPRWLLRSVRCLVALGVAAFLLVEGLILSGCFHQAPAGLDYVVVLGAKVDGTKPSGALRNRIQVAAEYLAQNSDTIAVASGGQGADEGISEAQCIWNGLTERGISPERILLEDQSTSTVENLRNSFAEIGNEGASVGVVSNDFHIYRALRTARKLGNYDVYGVPVATSWISLPHYLLREFCCVVVDGLLGHL